MDVMSLPPLIEPGPPLTIDERSRAARQISLAPVGEIGQRRLGAARVCVIGAGGLGAPAILYLAGAGVGTIGIIDSDTVETSNLQRQILHGTADVGLPKVESARRSITERSPNTHVRLHHTRLAAENAAEILRDYDIVLDGTDNFATRYLVSDACDELGIPLVWASVLRFDAQLAVFWSRPPAGHEAVSLRDLFPEPPEEGSVPSCAEAGVLGPLCGQVGSMMAGEALKLIMGIGETMLGRVAVFDSLTSRSFEIPLRRAGAAKEPHDGLPTLQYRQSQPQPRWITADELAQRIAQLENTIPSVPLTIIDVREQVELNTGVIQGSKNIVLAEILNRPDSIEHEPEHEIVVYCERGPRSQQAAQTLAQAGFTNVRMLRDGMAGWRERP